MRPARFVQQAQLQLFEQLAFRAVRVPDSCLQKKEPMFGLFKKKSPLEKLQKKYEQLMKQSFELSKTDRAASDRKVAEAEEVLAEIEKLREQK